MIFDLYQTQLSIGFFGHLWVSGCWMNGQDGVNEVLIAGQIFDQGNTRFGCVVRKDDTQNPYL